MYFLRPLAIAVLLASSPMVLSQADSDNEPNRMEEVIVAGQFLYADTVNALEDTYPYFDVPQSLSLMSAADIRARGFNSIGEVIAYMPGVTTSQGEGHRDAVVFRGVRSTADFYIDGVRDDVQYYRPLYNLEQVEVLRGPNALLFGRGGTVACQTESQKAVIDEAFTQAQPRHSLGEVGGQIDHNASLSNSMALRVNAMVEQLDNHRDFYDGERRGFNPTLRIIWARVSSISYELVDHQRFIDRGIPTGVDGRPVEAWRMSFSEILQLIRLSWTLTFGVQHSTSETLKPMCRPSMVTMTALPEFLRLGYDEENTPDEVTLDGYVDNRASEHHIHGKYC